MNLATAVFDHEFGNGVSLRNRTLYGDYDKFYQNVYPEARRPWTRTASWWCRFPPTTMRSSARTSSTRPTWCFRSRPGRWSTSSSPAWRSAAKNRQLPQHRLFQRRARNRDRARQQSDDLDPVTFRQDEDDNDNHVEANVAAIYVQDQVKLSEHFQAVLGLRYDQFDVDFDNNRTGVRLEERR